MQRSAEHRSRTWPLAVGAVVGAVLAAYGLLGSRRAAAIQMPDGAVAVVNGRSISRADYDRALSAVATDRRDARVDAAARRHVLDRLIEEELLVQRGLELGLVSRDRRVRADLSAAVIDLLVARGEQLAEPSEAELRAFHQDNPERFESEPLERVAWRYFHVADGAAEEETRRRALGACQRWRAGERGDVGSDPPPAELPDGWLTVAKLGDYVGPTVARASLALEAGAVSQPIRAGGGYHLIRLIERRTPGARPYAEVRAEVRAAFLRASGDQRLRSFLDERRAEADVVVAEELP